MDFPDMMNLEERGPDSLIGRGPSYPWGGLYGGQIVAQSLVAAASTVDPQYRVHSLHAYFIRRGDSDEPIRFDVDRLRNGRNFVTRAVVARQSRGAIFHMSASFSSTPADRYLQPSPFPDVPPPDRVADGSWAKMMERRHIIDVDGRSTAWLRVPGAPADDPVVAAAALAFMSDDLATDCVRSQQQAADGVTGRHWGGISLDHAIWFHHPVTGNDWQLHDFRCEGLGTPRGLAKGQVFASDGTHLATVAQEVLLRPVTPPA
ncbi:MAG TPA: acyl-CoA thioesterase domain-containing protein [Acidimicrobiales bacterium]|nr:acyl-CoA thioesterase domain-containing protein [Acidimicrobiales bacterium]